MNISIKDKRTALTARLFPEGIPRLWCPPLTHYTDVGDIDFERTEVHITHISQWTKAYLIPGSTGDGWEMDDDEIRRLLAFDLNLAQKLNGKVLIGILKTDAKLAHQAILDTLEWLKEQTGAQNNEEVIEKTKLCGFTVCPPKGSNLSQEQIYHTLLPILQLQVPVALYQLPQVTENEMSPETVAALAAEFDNFYLLKDTSGHDRVAMAGLELNGIYLVRGAEGSYSKWLQTNGGPYDGFLLGSTNCFAKQLNTIIQDLTSGNLDAAQKLSERLTTTVDQVFNYVAGLPSGNPFSNAYKAIDHFFAHGPDAANTAPPRIHSGVKLPTEIIKMTGDVLTSYDLMPSKGYL
jgi:dihydrodipicolinate synthase/N-acetylneuraminate lyase